MLRSERAYIQYSKWRLRLDNLTPCLCIFTLACSTVLLLLTEPILSGLQRRLTIASSHVG